MAALWQIMSSPKKTDVYYDNLNVVFSYSQIRTFLYTRYEMLLR